ncbi:MAM and LDL-receptor class A domain-containing protein 1-like isoform X2 [Xenia sp. Carnegie-2017]|uniref:MAM and LDL-receptor class A domain-containing protein 1-like isoform X2 n=1 Tax=Xenia sp. Carnegie-2017 TaxID=2897299 RepID=UPI001F04FF92|nr:MAM and LDL-receptor class A domain-containing protein 1-like isoform X2 [Xenia sp. Carnegie-2017]
MMRSYKWKDTTITSNSLSMIFFLLVMAMLSQVESCDFQKGLGTTLCPWSNVQGDDDFDWKLSSLSLPSGAPRYDATGSSSGRYLFSKGRGSLVGEKAWLVGNYRNDSVKCFSFSYYMRGRHSVYLILNIYQEYFYNGHNLLLWSFGRYQRRLWKKGQVTVNFTMGLSRLIIESVSEFGNFMALENLAFTPGSCDTIPKIATPTNAYDCSIGSFFSFLSKKCEKCPTSTYQPHTKQTRCLTCNDGKTTINVGAVSEQECIKVERCDFQKGLGTTVCPWSNVQGDDDFDWKLSSLSLPSGAPRYDATGSSSGRYLFSKRRGSLVGEKAWLVGNYRNDSVTCFSFSYYMRGRHSGIALNVYQEFLYKKYLLLWSLSGDKGNKWKKGQITVNFTMGLSRLIIESVREFGNFMALDNLAFTPGSCDTIPNLAIVNDTYNCSTGSFFSFLSKKCEKCPTSTYQPHTKQTRCLTCNDGKTTINVGAVSEQECVKACPMGSFFEKRSGVCKQCPLHTYQPEMAKTECIECPNGRITLNTSSKNSEDCIQNCSAGSFYSFQTHQCEYCPVNFYQPHYGQIGCIACRNGTVTAENGTVNHLDCINEIIFHF